MNIPQEFFIEQKQCLVFSVLRNVLTVLTGHFTSCDDSNLLCSHVLPSNYTIYADLFLWIWFFCRNKKTLAGLEKKHGIRVQWQENDATFQNAQQRLSAKKKSNELLRLHKMASERTFLLELKTKYAGHYTDINNQLDVIEGVFH